MGSSCLSVVSLNWVFRSIGYLHTHYCMCVVVVLSMRYWRSVSSLDGCAYITVCSGSPTSYSHKGKVTLSCPESFRNWMMNIWLFTQALGISIPTTVCVLWSFYQCDIDGVFHRWMAVSISLSVLVVPLPTNVLFPILTSWFLCHTLLMIVIYH